MANRNFNPTNLKVAYLYNGQGWQFQVFGIIILEHTDLYFNINTNQSKGNKGGNNGSSIEVVDDNWRGVGNSICAYSTMDALNKVGNLTRTSPRLTFVGGVPLTTRTTLSGALWV